ncbi:MAG: hypothetical protein NC212_05670 [Staphylococcus sp.]|nr:hypothetical protein [Staphylococcus sp.]
MKRFYYSLFAFLLCAFVAPNFSISAKEPLDIEEYDNKADLTPVRRKDYPRMPSKKRIRCYYSPGKLMVEFIGGESESAEIYIGDVEYPIYMVLVTENCQVFEIPKLKGEYDIVCHTENDQYYYGTIVF